MGADRLAVNIFLDTDRVDELWTMLERKGITKEEIEDASEKAGGKIKIGLGDTLKLLIRAEAEMNFEAIEKKTKTIVHTPFLRSILLPELIDNISILDGAKNENIEALKADSFVRIICRRAELIQLPAIGSFMRQLALGLMGDNQEKIEKFTENTILNAISVIEKATSDERALNFVEIFKNASGLSEDGNFFGYSRSEIFKVILEKDSDFIFNSLSMSGNEHFLFLGSPEVERSDVVIKSILNDALLKRNLAAFAMTRGVEIFGQLSSVEKYDAHSTALSVMPISISLAPPPPDQHS